MQSLEMDIYLVQKIKDAAKKAIASLFENHKENFYYCSLITDGEGHCPILSAWSVEALERVVSENENPEEAKDYLKWSYADSPYCMYGEEYFTEVKKIFDDRMSNLHSDEEIDREIEVRINSMEKAILDLDKEGLFGTGEQRLNIVINAEFMPPDYTNTERALRLNPIEALREWLEEAAEE